MGRAIGIDLGTTNTVAAIKEGTLRVLQNSEGQNLTPSVVGVYNNQTVVGQMAVDRAPRTPKDTVYSIKRLMGRGFYDSEVQRVRNVCSYDIVEPADGGDDEVCVMLQGKPYSPSEISAMILKKIKDDAELRLNDQVEYAVITVPAYFTEKQKEATRRAGQLAGLKVQKILDEPTAAAIAFGIDNVGPDDSKTILVYDLGGGTFDASVLTIVGGIIAQLDIEGDMWLGGDDFDQKIMEYVLHHIENVHGIDARQDKRFMFTLKGRAEHAKNMLSSMDRTDITILGMLKNEDGDLIDVELEITRAEFERLIAAQVAESVELVRTAIENSGDTMTPEQIDHVLLVGGGSLIPLVRKSLAAAFGEAKLLMNADPMTCVAFGAAILAAKWSEQVECAKGHLNPGKNVTCDVCGGPLAATGGLDEACEVTGMHYGIQAEGDTFEVVIPKGSAFPSPQPVVWRFVTPRANLKRIRVPIYAGFDPIASRNEFQATVWLDLPDNVPENTPLEVAFGLDGDGILEKVSVRLLDGSGVKVEAYLDRGHTARSRMENKIEQLKRKKDELGITGMTAAAGERFEDVYDRATKALSADNPTLAAKHAEELEAILAAVGNQDEPEWRRKAIGLCNFTEVVLGYSFLLDPPRAQQLKMLLDQLASCLDHHDQPGSKQKFTELDKATDDLPVPINVMLYARRGIMSARATNMEIEADQIGVALTSIEAALRTGDPNRAVKLFDGIKPVINKVDQARDDVSHRRHETSDLRREAATALGDIGQTRTVRMPTSRIDKVHFSVASPPVVQPGQSFVVDVWAHLDRQRAEVLRRVEQARPQSDTPPIIRPKGPFKIERGTMLFVRLRLHAFRVTPPEDVILWAGEIGNATFEVTVPLEHSEGTIIGVVTVHWEGGLQIARVPLQLLVANQTHQREPTTYPVHHIRKAFASYAFPDRDDVLGRIQGMQKIAPDLDVFLDVVSLRSGEDWEKRLWQVIPENDVFYLFWSASAKASPWVEKEWRCALDRRGFDFIDPVPLVSPEEVLPPEELSKKHFNDWILAYRRGKPEGA